jgi:uncharacterized protein (TIGR03435 family)
MSLIQWAYVNFADGHFNPLGSVPITGGPGWIQTDLFTIDAKAERPETSGTLNGPMLRPLLVERFRLKIHTESKETPVYALLVAKSGAKLQASRHDCVVIDPEHPQIPVQPGKPLPTLCGMGRLNGQGWEAFAVTMGRFARLLSDYADRKVIDRTGVTGTYDIHLNLTAEDLGHSEDGDAGPSPGAADVFARVRASMRSLGLRLEPTKARNDVIMIDAADKPSGN